MSYKFDDKMKEGLSRGEKLFSKVLRDKRIIENAEEDLDEYYEKTQKTSPGLEKGKKNFSNAEEKSYMPNGCSGKNGCGGKMNTAHETCPECGAHLRSRQAHKSGCGLIDSESTDPNHWSHPKNNLTSSDSEAGSSHLSNDSKKCPECGGVLKTFAMTGTGETGYECKACDRDFRDFQLKNGLGWDSASDSDECKCQHAVSSHQQHGSKHQCTICSCAGFNNTKENAGPGKCKECGQGLSENDEDYGECSNNRCSIGRRQMALRAEGEEKENSEGFRGEVGLDNASPEHPEYLVTYDQTNLSRTEMKKGLQVTLQMGKMSDSDIERHFKDTYLQPTKIVKIQKIENSESKKYKCKGCNQEWDKRSDAEEHEVARGSSHQYELKNGTATPTSKKCPTCDGPVVPTEGVSGSNHQYTCKRCNQDFDTTELRNDVFEIEKATAEVQEKSTLQINNETAHTWCSRAVACYELAQAEPDEKKKDLLINRANDFKHEALEHAALINDGGKLVGEIEDLCGKFDPTPVEERVNDDRPEYPHDILPNSKKGVGRGNLKYGSK